jgi:hypothetical protein
LQPPEIAGGITVTLQDLFDHLGTDRLGYSERCKGLSGEWVEFAAHVVRTHDDRQWMVVDQPGACPDCSPVPVAAMQLPGFDPPPGTDLSGPVTLRGNLSYGFAIGEDGYASFLRLEQARLVVLAGGAST